MIPPDREIFEIEQRIALRREQLRRAARQTEERALQVLASPAALIGAVALGFVVGGGVGKRQKHPVDRRKNSARAAKATGIAGVLMTGAMWLVRSQFGSPLQLAQFVLSKFSSRKTSPQLR